MQPVLKLVLCFDNKTTYKKVMCLAKFSDKLHDFKDFLRKEKSEENLNFWLDAENYRSLKRGSFCLEAQRIFQMYFLSTSPYEVSKVVRHHKCSQCDYETVSGLLRCCPFDLPERKCQISNE